MELTEDGVYIPLECLRTSEARRVRGKIDLYILSRKVLRLNGYVLEAGTRYPHKKTKYPAYLGAFLLKKGRVYVGYDKPTLAIETVKFLTGTRGDYFRKAELPVEEFVNQYITPTEEEYERALRMKSVSDCWEERIRLITVQDH